MRASGTVLVALLTLWAIDRVDLALYATFGAFTSVYAAVPLATRWRTQSALGVVLTAAVASGALVGLADERRWLSIPVAAAWAGLAAALSDRFRWRPPGPLFATFAVAACASIPTSVGDLVPAVVTAGGTAALAVVLGVVDARLQRGGGEPSAPATIRHPRRRRITQVVRCAAAVVVAGVVATGLGIGHPYWAMFSAVVPLAAPDLRGQLDRGVHRLVGTGGGLVVAGVLLLVSLPVLAVLVVAAALQGMTELLVARSYGLALVFITPLALLLGQLADHEPVGSLLTDRLVETVLGVAVGLAAAVLTRGRDVPADSV